MACSPKLFALLIASAAVASGGCERMLSRSEARASRARGTSGQVLIGLAWSSSVSSRFDPGLSFWDGADLAVEGLNGEAKLPHPIGVLKQYEDGTMLRSKEVAQTFAENLDVVAVIGHREADVARMASVVYEDAGLAMLAAGSSNRAIDRAGFELIFRLMPTDEELASHLADVALARKLSPVLIVYSNDAHGRAVANAFESRAESLGVKISERLSFESGSYRALEQALEDSKSSEPGALLLAERLPAAADVLERIRKVGLTMPVLATDDLDSVSIPPLAIADGVVVATPFVAESSDDQALVSDFKRKYGRVPDTWASQGYYGVRLVAEAMMRAGSAEPTAIARALREEGSRVRFGVRGEPLDRKIAVKQVIKKRFVGGAAPAPEE